MIIPGPALAMSARVAAALEPAIGDAEARARRDGLPVDPEVATALAELHQLANWWRARASVPLDGAAETRSLSGPMTTDEAAAQLGVTTSRVRQRLRAGTLAGERSNGRWWVAPWQ